MVSTGSLTAHKGEKQAAEPWELKCRALPEAGSENRGQAVRGLAQMLNSEHRVTASNREDQAAEPRELEWGVSSLQMQQPVRSFVVPDTPWTW